MVAFSSSNVVMAEVALLCAVEEETLPDEVEDEL
jgi:hypothetical protein